MHTALTVSALLLVAPAPPARGHGQVPQHLVGIWDARWLYSDGSRCPMTVEFSRRGGVDWLSLGSLGNWRGPCEFRRHQLFFRAGADTGFTARLRRVWGGWDLEIKGGRYDGSVIRLYDCRHYGN